MKLPHKGKVKQVSLQVKQVPQPSQAEGEAPAPPKENPPAPTPSDPKPGTSKDPTDTPAIDPTQDPTQASTQNPEQDTLPNRTDYVKDYQQAGKVWLDTVLANKEQAYYNLFDKLLQLGDPHIEKFPNADKQTVMKCIKDRTGRFLSEDEFAVYVEKEDVDTKKPKVKIKVMLKKL